MRWLTEEQLAEAQRKAAERLQATSPSVRTVRVMRTEEEAAEGAKLASDARKANLGRRRQALELSEAVVLKDCSRLLDQHPRVAFWWRVNTGGALTLSGRYVKYSFVGASDLMFVIQGSGRFGACECKATGKKASADQAAFGENVIRAGGFFVCVDHAGMLALALREL